jgi:hypothetical protein
VDEHRHSPVTDERTVEFLEAILAEPGRWASLDPELLRHLVYYQCLSYGINSDDALIARLMGVYRVGVDRLHPAVRQQIALHVARAIERMHRQHRMPDGAGCTNGLLPFLIEDPDPSVVATAAMEMAILLPLEDQDPLSGPKYVRTMFDQLAFDDAKAGLVAGLLQVGDHRVWPFVDGTWLGLTGNAPQTLALLIQGFRGLSILTAEFLLSWLEYAGRDPSSALFGIVTATMARAGGHAAEHGIADVERILPVTDRPEDNPFSITRTWALDDFAPRIANRLLAVAASERPPRLMLHVLAYWGLNDYAYRIGLEAACLAEVGESAATMPAGERVRPEAPSILPLSLEISPEWGDDADTLLEWGTFGAAAPTIDTWRAASVPGVGRLALVHTRYHPSRDRSCLVSLLPAHATGDDTAVVLADALRRLPYEPDNLASAPAYVDVPATSPLTAAWVVRTLGEALALRTSSPLTVCKAQVAAALSRDRVDEAKSRVPALWEEARTRVEREPPSE